MIEILVIGGWLIAAASAVACTLLQTWSLWTWFTECRTPREESANLASQRYNRPVDTSDGGRWVLSGISANHITTDI